MPLRPFLYIPLFSLLLVLGGWASASAISAAPTGLELDVSGGRVYAMVLQPDGRVLIGGSFTKVEGMTRNRLARLNPDGSLDLSFTASSALAVTGIVVQDDGRILVLSGPGAGRVVRLKADGSADSSFAPSLTGDASNPLDIQALAIQQDGKILVGGNITAVGGITRRGMARLTPTGSLDSTFNTALSSDADIHSIALQPDGKILIGGSLSSGNLQRLTATGSRDFPFGGGVAGNVISNLIVQPDGRVLCGHISKLLFRVDSEGAIDPDFDITGTSSGNSSTLSYGSMLQTDGKVMVCGPFQTVEGVTRSALARVQANGLLDGFDAGLQTGVIGDCALMLGDGRVLLSRRHDINVPNRKNLILLGNAPGSQSLTVHETDTIRWLRSGALPEVTRAHFEVSSDGGQSWSLLGYASRISGGWELTDASLPATGEVRASGRVSSGGNNISSGLVRTVTVFGEAAPALAVEQPAGTVLTNGDSNVTFPATVSGEASSPVTVVVRNTGTATLSLQGWEWADNGQGQHFKLDFSGTVMDLAAGQQTSFRITFKPQQVAASLGAVLHLYHNAADSPFTIQVTGSALPSTNASVKTILLGFETIPPSYVNPSLETSTVNVPFILNAVVAAVTPEHGKATVTINGALAAGGVTGTMALPVGTTVLKIVTTAEDGVTQKTNTVSIVRAAPVPGDVDPSFNAQLDSPLSLKALAIQADGGLLVGGSFFWIGGMNRFGYARFRPDGSFDTNYFARGDLTVNVISVDHKDRAVVGGSFDTFNGSSLHRRLVRVNSNGTIDSTLKLPNTVVYGVSHLSDGRLAIQADFNPDDYGGPRRITVLNSDGTPHNDFNLPNLDPFFTLPPTFISDTHLLLGQNEEILMIRADGTPEPTFSPEVYGQVTAVLMDRDGSGMLLAGELKRKSDHQTLPSVVRITREGALDTQAAFAVYGVLSMARQADGKLLVGTIDDLVRLHADGSRDETFKVGSMDGQPALFGHIHHIALQPSGDIIVGGNFTGVGGLPRMGLARLMNGPASQVLEVPDSGLATWTRGGTAPEAASVRFEYSTDGGATWTLAGKGTPIDGGWKADNLDLPVSGILRARGMVPSGGSSGVVQSSTTFAFEPAEVVLSRDNGEIENGGSADFGEVGLGGMSEMTFVLGNKGGVSLKNATVSVAGPDAEFFTVTAPPPILVAPGSSGNFTMRFSPAELGTRTAVLHVSSGDPQEPDFIVNISGTGITGVKPVVTTLLAANVLIESADIAGSADERGFDREFFFEYGVAAALGSTAAAQPNGADKSGAALFKATLQNLLPHTKYHYRMRAAGVMGGAAGTIRTFTTGNRAPTLADDATVLLPGATVALDVIANDEGGDPDGDSLSLVSFKELSPASAGRLTKSGNQLIFTASASFKGATCRYTASDGFGGTATATLAFAVGDCDAEAVPVVPAIGGVVPIAVNASGFWTVAESAPWLSVNPTGSFEGSSASVQILVQPNAGKTERRTTLIVGGKPLEVRQAGVTRPTLMHVGSWEGQVSGQYQVPLQVEFNSPAEVSPVNFRARNLPPGLTLNAKTGLISGTLTKADVYRVYAVASNAQGVSEEIFFDVTVKPLHPETVGVFHGYAVGNPTVNGNLGSRVELMTTATGGLSGKIITGTASRPFTGRQTLGELHAVIKNGAGTMTFQGSISEDGTLGETWLSADGQMARVFAWRNPWTAASKASAFKGRYTFAMERSDMGDATFPQGHGFGAFTIAENSGSLTVAGRLADGTPLATKTFVGKKGQVLLYQPLQNGKGSLVGHLNVNAGTAPADNSIIGNPAWFRAEGASPRLCSAGFPPTLLTAFGSAYPALNTGAVLMELDPGISPNAKLDFTLRGLDGEKQEFSQGLTISSAGANTATNRVVIQDPLHSLSLPVLNTSTGAFNGVFTLAGGTAALNRKAAFHGQMVRRDGTLRGYGHFILGEARATAKEQGVAPQHSGAVFLRPSP